MQNDSNVNRRILIIDDNESIHEDFKDILCSNKEKSLALENAKNAIFGKKENQFVHDDFIVDSAYQGEDGYKKVIKAMELGEPYAMAFVDVRMPPGWDGVETIKKLWEVAPNLQVVICTAHSDYSWHEMIQELGYTDRLLIIKKPFDNIEVLQVASSLIRKSHLLNNLDKLVIERTKEIDETRNVAVFVLAKLAESRDPETGEHLERIQSYCQVIAEYLSENGPYQNQINNSFLEDIYRSSPLHDIGKVGIPDNVLLKPGKLTEQEFEVMKTHTVIGAKALEFAVKKTRSGSFLNMGIDIARYHHERFNGKGYPDKLKGQNIPLSARITAIADVYDALTSERIYKSAYSLEKAKSMIVEERGEYFDPVIVDAFLEKFDDFIMIKKKFDID